MAKQETVRHYDAQYSQFASRLYGEVRTAAFGEDIGQNGWLTADEHDLFIRWLDLDPRSTLLDVASGSGGSTLRIAHLTGCTVHGIDIHPHGVAAATLMARRWRGARADRAAELRSIEGDETFEGQQTFLEVAARLASERRLSRVAFRAMRQ